MDGECVRSENERARAGVAEDVARAHLGVSAAMEEAAAAAAAADTAAESLRDLVLRSIASGGGSGGSGGGGSLGRPSDAKLRDAATDALRLSRCVGERVCEKIRKVIAPINSATGAVQAP